MTTPADNTVNTYLQSKVMSATPEELRMMLLDGAVKFANQAKVGLEESDHELIYAGFTQCRAIVMELITTIDHQHAPEVTEKVSSLYSFMYAELIAARQDMDIPRLDKVIELLEFERETWGLLLEKLRQQSGQAADSAGKSSLSLQA